MSISLQWILVAALFLATVPHKSAGEFEQWCVADEADPDDELQAAMDWACAQGGVDCTAIQVNQPCYLPNTVRACASYAFNSYYQSSRARGSCYFRSAAMTTELDPSHGSCHYDYLP
ncbi:glucan endo-1,3-beta-glucosidase 12-like [Eucalyptus grandis]|uniref:glucan endo-1,3-beta-glucosidase 12-like n=1 Tax=Eucalyptus grandis TaxID=71139 RepID=UPI00192EF6DE|nr:glucan endo-1,3-beta-glucosidase 12-like [Eucalyptus grandis]